MLIEPTLACSLCQNAVAPNVSVIYQLSLNNPGSQHGGLLLCHLPQLVVYIALSMYYINSQVNPGHMLVQQGRRCNAS
jgi:hypothetical protein